MKIARERRGRESDATKLITIPLSDRRKLTRALCVPSRIAEYLSLIARNAVGYFWATRAISSIGNAANFHATVRNPLTDRRYGDGGATTCRRLSQRRIAIDKKASYLPRRTIYSRNRLTSRCCFREHLPPRCPNLALFADDLHLARYIHVDTFARRARVELSSLRFRPRRRPLQEQCDRRAQTLPGNNAAAT